MSKLESHHIWSSVRNIYDSRRAQIKCRILTGTYILQSNRAVFNQYAVDPMCKICESGPENRQHFLVECQPPQEVRQVFTKLRAATDVNLQETVVVSRCDATQLILDPSVFFENKTVIDTIELFSRELISNLREHVQNTYLKNKDNGSREFPLKCVWRQFQQTAETTYSDKEIQEINVDQMVRHKVTGRALQLTNQPMVTRNSNTWCNYNILETLHWAGLIYECFGFLLTQLTYFSCF